MTIRRAYLALGSNLGDRSKHLADARELITEADGCSVIACTEVEETDPVGNTDQGRFLNQMLAVDTVLPPKRLLCLCREVEHHGGRVRDAKWGPRTIDVDIVMIEGVELNTADLVVPHPELPNRQFWQRELKELDETLRRGGSE